MKPNGDPELDELVTSTYEELRGLAHGVRSKPIGKSHQTTSLVHEAYLRLSKNKKLAFRNKAHFLKVAARAMRQFLLDSARQSLAAKRGGGRAHLPMEAGIERSMDPASELIDLNEALTRLSAIDKRKGQIVELRYFGGLTMEESAKSLQISIATAERDWAYARSWLFREMSADNPSRD